MLSIGEASALCSYCKECYVGRRKSIPHAQIPESVESLLEECEFRVTFRYPVCPGCAAALRYDSHMAKRFISEASMTSEMEDAVRREKARYDKKHTVTPEVIASVLKIVKKLQA